MEQVSFFKAIKKHCIDQDADCTKCDLRLYCYTPPCELTDYMMQKVISFLEIQRNNIGNESHSDHRTSEHQRPCPCKLDMSSALGYEPH